MVVYLLACLFPALQVSGTYGIRLHGWECLTLFPILWWWANPLYALALIATWRRWFKTALMLSIVAVGLGAHLQIISEPREILVGFYFWMISMQIVVMNAGWMLWKQRQQPLYGVAKESLISLPELQLDVSSHSEANS